MITLLYWGSWVESGERVTIEVLGNWALITTQSTDSARTFSKPASPPSAPRHTWPVWRE